MALMYIHVWNSIKIKFSSKTAYLCIVTCRHHFFFTWIPPPPLNVTQLWTHRLRYHLFLDQLTCKNHNCKRLNVIFIALSPRSPPTPPTLWVDCINDYMYKEYPHSLLTIVPKCQVPAKSCMLCLRIGKSCLIIW